MRHTVELLPGRCIACGACVVACRDQNSTGLPLRRIEIREEGRGRQVRFAYRSVSCRHCEDAPCLAACPADCISRDPSTGFVLLDPGRCIGCGRCAEVCPAGAPIPDDDGIMHKCDGCVDRVRQGLLPACVKVCPFDALRLASHPESNG